MDNLIDNLRSKLEAAQFQQKTSSSSNGFMNAVIQLLNRYDDKFNTYELLGLLGFFNLFGIISFLSRENSSPALPPKITNSLTPEQSRERPLEKNADLLNIFLELLPEKEKLKLNPANLVYLLTLLNEFQNINENREPTEAESCSIPRKIPTNIPKSHVSAEKTGEQGKSSAGLPLSAQQDNLSDCPCQEDKDDKNPKDLPSTPLQWCFPE